MVFFHERLGGPLNDYYDWSEYNQDARYPDGAIIANRTFANVALTEPIASVGFPLSLLRMTQQITRETGERGRSEQGGFFGGVVKDGVFCIFDHYTRGMNCNGSLDFCYDMSPMNIEIARRTIEAIHGYRTVVYHNHPPESQKSLVALLGEEEARVCIEIIRRSLESGVYASLGITELDDAINEDVSRMISEEDVKNTPGRYNLIVSPTLKKSNPLDHLNFYDLTENRLVPVRKIKESVVRKEEQRRREVSRQYYIENFGSDKIWDLDGEAYLKAFYDMNGLTYGMPIPGLNKRT